MTSNPELARQLGVSETAVRRAEKASRIKREADGAWDPGKVKAAWASNTDRAQQRGAPSAGDASRREARHAVKPVPQSALGFVTPLIAALSMSASSLLVVGNALRLGRGWPA